jgi:hypothetical protein
MSKFSPQAGGEELVEELRRNVFAGDWIGKVRRDSDYHKSCLNDAPLTHTDSAG